MRALSRSRAWSRDCADRPRPKSFPCLQLADALGRVIELANWSRRRRREHALLSEESASPASLHRAEPLDFLPVMHRCTRVSPCIKPLRR